MYSSIVTWPITMAFLVIKRAFYMPVNLLGKLYQQIDERVMNEPSKEKSS
ncbi:MAG: hypothetical protein HC814_06570 [Rhodobacteraceae bacterium]|nr:hypothetical protein [Paracoccaceae bacterium]